MKMVWAAVAAGFALASAGSAANAAIVTFSGSPASTFADGVFSSGLSTSFPDGFYSTSTTSAYNGYGQTGEYIRFNSATTVNSLSLGKCGGCYDSHPATFTVSLYDAVDGFINAFTVNASSTPELISINEPGVKKLVFTFDGEDGTNPYAGDTRPVAWYEVSGVSYGTAGVPEPAVWAMMIGGLGLAGAALRRRRALAA